MKAASRLPSSCVAPGGRSRQPLVRLELDTPVVVAPRARDATVDEKGRHRRRVLRGEDDRPVLLRQDARAARVDEQDSVPPGQEANRRRRVGGRQWSTGRSSSSRPCSSRKRRSRNRSSAGASSRTGTPAQDEASSIAAGPKPRRYERMRWSMPSVLRDGARPDPLLGERVVIGAAPLPRPRRRRADDVLPEPCASVELLRRDRAGEERAP